jgi:hypothetical protein
MTGDKKVVIKINLPTSAITKDSHESHSLRQVTEWNIKRLVIVSFIFLILFAVLLYLLLGPGSSQDEYMNTVKKQNKINFQAEQSKPPADITEVVDINETMPGSVAIETEGKTSDSNSSIDQDIYPSSSDNKGTVALVKDIKTSSVVIEDDSNRTKSQEQPIISQGVVRAELATNINNKEPAGQVKLPFVVNQTSARALFYFTELIDRQGKIFYHQWNYQGKTIFKKKINVLGNRWRASTRKMISNRSLGEWNVRLLDHNGHIINEIAFTVVEDN